jgi:transposase
MKVSGIDIESNINNIKVQIEADNTLSPSMRIAMDLLLLIVTLLCRRLGLNSNNSNNSNNSSIPSSSVQNRKKNSNGNSTKKSDGQKRHKGTTLPLDDNPDITHKLIVDSTTAQ